MGAAVRPLPIGRPFGQPSQRYDYASKVARGLDRPT